MRLYILFILISFSSPLFAQPPSNQNTSIQGFIDGKVLDSLNKTPLEYVMIRVFKITDSSLVSGIYTGENGSFVLENIPVGKYFIRISNGGYKDKVISNIQLTAQKNIRKLGNIALVSSEKSIEEVVITNEKSALQIGIDKKVYNVGDDISVNGGSANEVLNNIPSVDIDQDGKVSLRGDGNVTILIDGKPSSLSGGNGKSLLDGIPAGSIERIEIVNNPSAKYDPDGTSGIINIVLKKNIKRGLNGSINLSAGTGNAYTGSANASLRNTKFNLFGNYSYDYKEGQRDNKSFLEQRYTDSTVLFDQNRVGTDFNAGHTAKIGMDVYLKDRNTLSWNVSGNIGDRDRYGDQLNYRYTSKMDTLGIWNRIASDPSQNQNFDFGLNYNWEFKADKGSIDWNAYQSLGKSANQGYYDQIFTYPADSASISQRLFNTEDNNITTLSMDVVRIFSKVRTESGLKLIHRNMGVDTESDSRNSSGDYVADTLAFFKYSYNERIYSAYGMVSGIVKKWKYQAGLRLEQSFQEPNLVSKNESYSNRYLNLFPSAFIRRAFAKSAEFSLGYSKRINRASAENLNPFTSYADPYNLRRGNPALGPEYIHSIDLSVELTSKKWSINGSLYQRFSNNVIQRVRVFYPDGTSAGTLANIDKSISTGGELVLQVKPIPTWRNTLSGNANYIVFTDNTTGVNYNREGFVWGLKLTSLVELMKKSLTVQVNGRYNAPAVSPSGKFNARGSVDLSIDKSFKEGKWGIGARLTDVFDTQSFSFIADQGNSVFTTSFKQQTRRFYINVRYKFGKTELSDRKKSGDSPSGGGGGFDF